MNLVKYSIGLQGSDIQEIIDRYDDQKSKKEGPKKHYDSSRTLNLVRNALRRSASELLIGHKPLAQAHYSLANRLLARMVERETPGNFNSNLAEAVISVRSFEEKYSNKMGWSEDSR